MRQRFVMLGLLFCVTVPQRVHAQLSLPDDRSLRVMIAATRATGAADGTPAPILEYCAAVRVLGATLTEALRARRAAISAPADTASAAGCFDGLGDHYRVLQEFRVDGNAAFIKAHVRRGQTRFVEEIVLSGGSDGFIWFVVSRLQRDFVFEH